MKGKIGYTHGRFQPFHKGHLNILTYILDNYEELWVGLANPLRRLPPNIEEYDNDLKDSVKKARSLHKNIFTFLERRSMIVNSLHSLGYDRNRIFVLPHFGYYEEENWKDFIPTKDTTIVLHSKDPHHDKKIQRYKELNWEIEALPEFEGGISGTQFHSEFPNGNWRSLVTKETQQIIETHLKKK